MTINVLLVNPKLGIASVAQLIEQARRAPGSLNFASTSLGGSPHLSGELFNRLAKVDIRHVPYKGSAPAMTDLVAGRLQLYFDNLPGVLPQLREGRARAIAVAGARRADWRGFSSGTCGIRSLRSRASASTSMRLHLAKEAGTASTTGGAEEASRRARSFRSASGDFGTDVPMVWRRRIFLAMER